MAVIRPRPATVGVESSIEKALREWATRVWRRHLLEQGEKERAGARVRNCPCGAVFTLPPQARNGRWCDECKTWNEATWNHEARQRLRPGASWEFVSRRVLFAEANGLCLICGDALGDSWEIDHIIPVGEGGSHTYDNTRVVHKLCNRSRPRSIPKSAAAKRAYARRHGSNPLTELAG